MQKTLALCSLLLGLTSMADNATANADQSDPPLQYPLSRVTISVLHQTSRNIPGGYRITLSGEGSGTMILSEAGREIEARIQSSEEELITLLNDFYRIHFFELADNYTVKKQVLLQEDGTVATTGRRLLDIASKRLCIELADYKKCVSVVDGQPAGAAQLVEKIEGMFGN